ncbi:ATP-binding protein [Mucilaginibacter auburnensis]|uniref:Histidine kinase-like protein n=1 Tax=Mucilaginibacter auburnensis TaxID=1457233 RepID=A0A2H9VVW3_9SPHI|nr:ATP-binding protein [Mucilaginibacter auburnensis]PJJ84965.1 histidine kinase-like protein [Mucilaginibacter auburnensis]
MPGKVFSQFVLPNTQQGMVNSLKEIRGFINDFLPEHAASEDLNYKVEIVITELITNALKHVKNADSFIRIYLDNNYLTIEKTDFGAQFNPNGFANIFKQQPGYKILLSYDELHSLYAYLESNNVVRFVCEAKRNRNKIDINGVGEHFGMVIISRSAESFTYHYDAASGLNRFNVRMKLSA